MGRQFLLLMLVGSCYYYGATSREGTVYPSRAPEFTPDGQWVRVTTRVPLVERNSPIQSEFTLGGFVLDQQRRNSTPEHLSSLYQWRVTTTGASSREGTVYLHLPEHPLLMFCGFTTRVPLVERNCHPSRVSSLWMGQTVPSLLVAPVVVTRTHQHQE